MANLGHDPFNYEGMYNVDAEVLWRKIGAKNKVDNQLETYRRIPLHGNLNVLEIGCGDGSIALEMSRNGLFKNYTGLDISKSGITVATALKIRNANLLCLNVEEIENYSSTFDLTVFCHVIEHLENPRILLNKAAEWSKQILVEVPLKDNFGLPNDYDWDPVGHINKFNPKTFRQLLQTSGWQIVETKIYNPSWEVCKFLNSSFKSKLKWIIKDIFLRMNPRLAAKLFTYHCIVLANRNE